MTHAELTAIAYACSVAVVAGTAWIIWWAIRLFWRIVAPVSRVYAGQRRVYRYLLAHPEELAKVKIARTGIYPRRGGSLGSGVVGGIVGYELGHHLGGDSLSEPHHEDVPW